MKLPRFFDPYNFQLNLLLLLLPLLSFQLAFCYTNTGYHIRDLQRNDGCIYLETAYWSATALVSGQPLYSKCDDTYLLGGANILGSGNQYGQYFYITYTSLPYHTYVYFSLTLFAIDNWSSDQILFQVGSTNLYTWTNFDKNNFDQNYCGIASKDLKNVRIFGRAYDYGFSGSSITFRVISYLNGPSNNKAFGIRDLELLFANPSPYPGSDICGLASISIAYPKECTCGEGYYWTGSSCAVCDPACQGCFGPWASQCYSCKIGYMYNGGNCVACDLSCATCYGSLYTQCKSCKPGYLLYQNTTCVPLSSCAPPLIQTGCESFCESPCVNPAHFLYWNGSCLTTCTFPHQSTTLFGSLKLCIYPCDSSQYLLWDGTCSEQCTLPLLTRIEGGKNYCDYPCLAAQFLYWNGTCASGCVFPHAQGTIGGKKFCYYVCTNTQYLYWDGTCSSSCNTPLLIRTEGGKNYCDYPCKPYEFLYWDGHCGADCNVPYHQNIQWGSYFCIYPCSGSDYLYWDGVCESTCGTYYVPSAIGGKNYCNPPCAANQYLFWNGTCLGSCEAPLVRKFRAELNFCVYPCNPGEYLYYNGSCINNCKLPFAARQVAGKDYCNPLCPQRYQLLWNGTCIRKCEFPLHFTTNVSGTVCNLPCNSSSKYYHEETRQCTSTCNTSVVYQGGFYLRCLLPEAPIKYVELSRLLQHIRYLNIKLPRKLELLTVNRRMNILSMRLVPSTFDSIREYIIKPSPSSNFWKYSFSSGFVENLYDELLLMAIILVLGISFGVLEVVFKIFSCCFYPQIIFERLRIFALWNILIILLTVNAGDIIFFAPLEIKEFNLSSIQSCISFGLCIGLILVLIILYGTSLFIIYKIQTFKESSLKNESTGFYTDYLLKLEPFQVIFRGFNDTNILTHSFYLTYGLRLVLPMLIATFLSVLPILQSLIYLVISCGMVAFLVYYRPIKDFVNQMYLTIIETIVLVVHVCLFFMTLLDFCGVSIYGGHVFLADVIIAMNFCIDLAAGLFLPVKIYAAVQHALQLRRKCASEELGAWLHLFFIPIQQGGLGFEEVQIVSSFTITRLKARTRSFKIAPSSQAAQDSGFKPLSARNVIKQPTPPAPLPVEPLPQLVEVSAVEENMETLEGLEQSPRIEGADQDPMNGPRAKKRKRNLKKNTFDTIQEFGDNEEEGENQLSLRLKNLSNYFPKTLRDGYVERSTVSNQFDNNNLDMSQLNPFNLHSSVVYEKKEKAANLRYQNEEDDF